jgi:hypothetical protein
MGFLRVWHAARRQAQSRRTSASQPASERRPGRCRAQRDGEHLGIRAGQNRPGAGRDGHRPVGDGVIDQHVQVDEQVFGWQHRRRASVAEASVDTRFVATRAPFLSRRTHIARLSTRAGPPIVRRRLRIGPKLRPRHPKTPGLRSWSERLCCSDVVVRDWVEPPNFRVSVLRTTWRGSPPTVCPARQLSATSRALSRTPVNETETETGAGRSTPGNRKGAVGHGACSGWSWAATRA